MQKKEIKEWIIEYVNKLIDEDWDYDDPDITEEDKEEIFDDKFHERFGWEPQYPDDITYEVSELLDYLCTPFEVLSSWKDWDYYVEVLAHMDYINKWLLLDNSKGIDEFTFGSIDELVNWIDKIQGDFINVQEELKQHFTS